MSISKLTKIGMILFFVLVVSDYSICYAQNNNKIIDTTEIVRELREKEKTLNIREADLNAKEARLNAMEQDLLARESDIKKIRDEVTKQLEALGNIKDKELDNLVNIYSKAKPKSAAIIISKMDTTTAIAIFKRMTPNISGKIVDAMSKVDPIYASKMAEMLTNQPKFGVDK